jgi:hypothetical protein
MNKQVFSASSVTKILEFSATSEVVDAIESAVLRGIMTTYGDFATGASWWRNTEGFLFATHAKAIVPQSRRVELIWEEGLGYLAAA